MKTIYLAHSRDLRFDYQKELYDAFFNNFSDFDIIVPHINHAESSFNSKLIIPTCSFLIAEVSYPSTGLGMELAWAEAAKVPILCLHKKNTLPSSSVFNLCSDVKNYIDSSDYVNIVRDWIEVC